MTREKSWSRPVAAPASLNGERHKAEYLPDGRLFITFRSIERDLRKNLKHSENKLRGWYSEGWVALVADYNDLKNGGEGDYRIKVAHTYLDSQSEPCVRQMLTRATAETSFCPTVLRLSVLTVSFPLRKKKNGVYSTDKGRKKRRTYIISKRNKREGCRKSYSADKNQPNVKSELVKSRILIPTELKIRIKNPESESL